MQVLAYSPVNSLVLFWIGNKDWERDLVVMVIIYL